MVPSTPQACDGFLEQVVFFSAFFLAWSASLATGSGGRTHFLLASTFLFLASSPIRVCSRPVEASEDAVLGLDGCYRKPFSTTLASAFLSIVRPARNSSSSFSTKRSQTSPAAIGLFFPSFSGTFDRSSSPFSFWSCLSTGRAGRDTYNQSGFMLEVCVLLICWSSFPFFFFFW